MITTLGILAAAAVGVWIILVAMVWHRQDRIVFQPPTFVREDVRATRVDISAADGAPLFVLTLGDPTRFSRVVVAYHGNADLARWYVPWAELLVQRTGAFVVLAEFRGYDDLPGRPTYATAALDAEAAHAWALSRTGVGARDVVLFGHSLGSAIVAELAVKHPPYTLILQSPFSSARAMAERMMIPGLTLFWRSVSRVHYETVSRVRELASPVWVAHGDRDLVVPLRMGEEVYAAARTRGEWLLVRGAGHNDVDELGGDTYWAWFERAMK